MLFKDGVFNNGLEGFSIRVGKKGKDGKTLNDIMIYDHRAMQGNNIILSAESGVMEQTADKMFLVLTLKNGVSYKEMADNPKDAETHPLIRDKFEERVIRFDLSEFKMSRTDEALFKNNAQMMNLSQLNNVVDSLKIKMDVRKKQFGKQLIQTYYSKYKLAESSGKEVANELTFDDLSKQQKLNAIEIASNIARSAKAYTESVYNDTDNDTFSVDRFNIEWHRKFTLSIACVVLFFIGAPLGAIIRKGGLGMPMVVSIIFFLVFHILSITGEKLAKEGTIPAYQGMWLATFILLPIGIFLTYKATSDSNLFNIDAYLSPIKSLFSKKNK